MAEIGSSDRIKVLSIKFRKYAGHATVESFVRAHPKGEQAALRSLRRDIRAGFVRLRRRRRRSDPEARWTKAAGVRSWLAVQAPTGDELNELRVAYHRSGVAKAVAGTTSSQERAVAAYTGNGFRPINHGLRSTGKAPAAFQDFIDKFDNMIASSHFKEDTIMYRGYGATADIQNNAPPPPEFMDHGFSSASFNPAVANVFSNKKTFYRLRIPAGTPGLALSRTGSDTDSMLCDEAEVVLPRGTTFRIVRRNPSEAYSGTFDVVDALVVPPKK